MQVLPQLRCFIIESDGSVIRAIDLQHCLNRDDYKVIQCLPAAFRISMLLLIRHEPVNDRHREGAKRENAVCCFPQSAATAGSSSASRRIVIDHRQDRGWNTALLGWFAHGYLGSSSSGWRWYAMRSGQGLKIARKTTSSAVNL